MLRSISGTAWRGGQARAIVATLAEEVPVALVYDGSTLALMMATPADLEDFALGFSLSEQVVAGPQGIVSQEIIARDEGIEIRSWLQPDRAVALQTRRRNLAGPVGCGLCGIESLDEAMRPLPQVGGTALRIDPAEIVAASAAMRQRQPLHDATRAVHAAGFLVPGSGLVLVREDVGRHNALDKLIGALVRQGIDPASGAAMMTSRVSIDLVQKCAIAGIPVLVAASAPTAQAVALAEKAGMTVLTRSRESGFDCHAGAYRLLQGNDDHAA